MIYCLEKMLIKGNNHMLNLESVQIIKDKEKPKFAVLDYELYLQLQEIVEDFLDHLHAESVLKKTGKDEWFDLQDVKNELGIK